MAFKIGFSVSEEKEKMTAPEPPDVAEEREPRRSVVRVQFPQRNMTLAYYNDRFDLHCGDLVYVDGKLQRESAGASWMSTTTSASIWRTISA